MIYRLSDFRFPDDPARLYPGTPERPWVLEIGFGDGRFWTAFAPTAGFPNYLGVELSGVSLLKAQKRLRAAGIENAHLTKLPALPLLEAVIPPGALSLIVVNFPDPWPKAGHVEHRLLRRPFFELAASRLRPGGELWLTTDHAEYFDFAREEARASGCFSEARPEPPAAALETKYALKWRELGLSAQHVRWTATRQPPAPAPDFQRPESEEHMPHAIVRLPQGFEISAFPKVTARAGSAVAVLLDAYRSVRRGEYALLAHVVEGELTQEVLIALIPRPDGSHLVKLGRFGGPVITPGVKAAVGAATDWLEGQGARVETRAY